MKLTIYDFGDCSVGIFPTSFEIDVPFEKSDLAIDALDWFKTEQLKIYKEFAEGRLTAFYDFETYD